MKNIVGLVNALILCACSTSMPLESHSELSVNTINKSQISGIETPKTIVVRDQISWKQLWLQHSKRDAMSSLPPVDFTKDMVLGVILGTRPDACYSVSIEKIHRINEKTIAEYSEFVPDKGAICPYGITSPSHFVVVNRPGFCGGWLV